MQEMKRKRIFFSDHRFSTCVSSRFGGLFATPEYLQLVSFGSVCLNLPDYPDRGRKAWGRRGSSRAGILVAGSPPTDTPRTPGPDLQKGKQSKLDKSTILCYHFILAGDTNQCVRLLILLYLVNWKKMLNPWATLQHHVFLLFERKL